MAPLDEDEVAANPAVEKFWTDREGRRWRRHGGLQQPLDPRRAQTLLRRPDVPLVIYRQGSIRWFFDAEEQATLVAFLLPKASPDYQGEDGVRITEWRSDADSPLLMFEQWC